MEYGGRHSLHVQIVLSFRSYRPLLDVTSYSFVVTLAAFFMGRDCSGMVPTTSIRFCGADVRTTRPHHAC